VVDCEQTRRADHARTELVPYLADRADLMVVIAGDGTLREVCAGLRAVSSGMPIGLIPTGNANVVAREQGIPLDPRAAVALLTRGVVRPLDMGYLRLHPTAEEDILFLAMVEIGFGAMVVHRVQSLRSGRLKTLYRRWGDPVYLAAAIGAMLSPAEKSFRLYQDNRSMPLQPTAAIIANTRCYAKGWAMAPDACMDDGRLDLICRGQTGPGVLLRAYHAAALKRHPPAAFSRTSQGRRFVVQSEAPLSVQMDGDALPSLKWMEIGVSPSRLQLIVPQ
jgi:diacylglycerol kinase family enzyme